MRMLPNGNIEITVQLMPDAYAALKRIEDRDGIELVNAVNLGIMTLDEVGQRATDAGSPLRDQLADETAG